MPAAEALPQLCHTSWQCWCSCERPKASGSCETDFRSATSGANTMLSRSARSPPDRHSAQNCCYWIGTRRASEAICRPSRAVTQQSLIAVNC